MQLSEVFAKRHEVNQAKKLFLMYKSKATQRGIYQKIDANMCKIMHRRLIDIVFEHSDVLSDKEYLELMNLKM